MSVRREQSAVVLPTGVIAAPASIAVETPQATAFAVPGRLLGRGRLLASRRLPGRVPAGLRRGLAGLWRLLGHCRRDPTAEPTGFGNAVARSGAMSGWRQALVPAAVAAPTATGIAGGIRLSGGFPPDVVRLQVFEAATNSLAAAVKLAAEPTSLFWDRTGLSAGDTRWYWLRAVSAEGNVSALAGPVTAIAL